MISQTRLVYKNESLKHFKTLYKQKTLTYRTPKIKQLFYILDGIV